MDSTKIDSMITVRSKSTRLPQKCFLPFAGKTVIEHIIDRALEFNIDPILCTTLEEDDNSLEKLATTRGIRYFRGSTEDKLKRWKDACEKYNVKKFVSIDADDLFFDRDLVYKSYNTIKDGYDFVTHPENLPYEGCVGYGITYDIINEACEIKKTDNTEMIWVFVEQIKNLKKAFLSTPDGRKNIRLTLDYKEDYWLMLVVERILGPYACMSEILSLFEKNPDLHKVNWFRNDEYKKNHQNISLT